MEEKGTAKKAGAKIGFGVLFILSCFIAMYILMEYHESIILVAVSAVLLLISAFLFMNATFSDKAKNLIPDLEEEDTPSTGAGDGEFKLKITKYMKEMESTQKELIDVLKNQNTLLQSQIENLEHEIYMLSEKQVNQAKTIIKFNKENARQLAISERETLEHVMQEIVKAIEENSTPVATGYVAPAAEPVMAAEYEISAEEPELEIPSMLEEVSEDELFAVEDLPGDDEFAMPDFPLLDSEEPALTEEEALSGEETFADEDVSSLFDMMEDLPAEEEIVVPEMPADIEIPMPEDLVTEPVAEEAPVVEEIAVAEPEPEPAPAENPMAGFGGDPNAMMTPEDIAKLLESMGK